MEENERGGEVAEKGKYDLETVMVDHHYPEPLAKYEDVIADPKLFTETLEDFHSRLGTKLRCDYLPSFFAEFSWRRGLRGK